jgi:iron-sulfur cluster repair protein YtfE (RIC family)
MAQKHVIDLDNPQGDLVSTLLDQHEQIRAAIDAVARTTTAESRQKAFDALRETLARHETAEEMIVRPLTRRMTNGDAIADARMDEENESKEVLAELERMDIASVEFARTFEKFGTAVLAHAQSEEAYEFPLLRRHLDAAKSKTAEDQLLLAEKTAPTHPHPSARSTAMNYVAGPFAAVADRARDALSRVWSD